MRVIVNGRLRQRSYETREGERRTVYEVEVDEVGPALKYATAKVTRTSRDSGGGGGFQGGGGQGGGYQGGGQPQGGFGGNQPQQGVTAAARAISRPTTRGRCPEAGGSGGFGGMDDEPCSIGSIPAGCSPPTPSMRYDLATTRPRSDRRRKER